MPTPPNPDRPPQQAAALKPGQTLRIDAACVADAHHEHTPGTLILRRLDSGWQVLHSGPTPKAADQTTSDSFAQLRALSQTVTQTLALPTSTILPPFVNAHTHLDLTAMGPRPYDPADGFEPWLGMIRAERPRTPDTIRAAVEQGIALSLAGGVVAVGDIAGHTGGEGGARLEPFEALDASPLLGISFVEFFAIGSIEKPAMDSIQQLLANHAELFAQTDPTRARLGLQPHAPYSVALSAYQRLLDLAPQNVPLSTHLAETLTERRFVQHAEGPQRALLESFGFWDESLLNAIGQGNSPIEHLRPILERSVREARPPWVLAHVNDASDSDLQTLARAGASVVYCPRAHNYFHNAPALGPHRWQDMLALADQGLNLCLGTDSIINLNTPDRITPLDDARLLYRQSLEAGNPIDPKLLLRMITTNPAKALGLPAEALKFQVGSALTVFNEIAGTRSLANVFETADRPRLHR